MSQTAAAGRNGQALLVPWLKRLFSEVQLSRTLLVPYTPLLLVDGGRTRNSLKNVGSRLRRMRIDTIVALSAHRPGPVLGVETSNNLVGAHEFDGMPARCYETSFEGNNDSELGVELIRRGQRHGLEIEERVTGEVDHAIWIPLSLMFPRKMPRIVPLRMAAGHDLELHRRWGEVAGGAVRGRHSVLVIAAGNLSYKQDIMRTHSRAGAYNTACSQLDELILVMLKHGAGEGIDAIEPGLKLRSQPEADLAHLAFLLGIAGARRLTGRAGSTTICYEPSYFSLGMATIALF